MSLQKDIIEMGERGLAASRALGTLKTRKKNAILEAMADALDARREEILSANRADLAAAKENGITGPLYDRLELTPERFDGMVKGVRDIIALPDPVGTSIASWMRPNGLEIEKRRVPIGVIGIIYESRPNVTADASALCFKSSNAVILRGGSEAKHSNQAIANVLQEGGETKGLPPYSIQLVQTTRREAVKELVQLDNYLDLVIPRGGHSLIEAVTQMATVPVIKHYNGICHVYVDAAADLDMAEAISVNAKCQRPGVCNALETLVVHEDIAPTFLPRVIAALRAENVEIRGDEAVVACVPDVLPATAEDWDAEYLDLILAIKVVSNVKSAIAFINHHGSHHSDSIVTNCEKAERKFLGEVDSAAVYVNASTRFTDGAEFGLGAEMGISTDKLHARGPMGLEELTTYKYVIRGTGQTR